MTETIGARTAQYLRMSTDHQKYSIANQAAAIAAYAETRDLQIVRTYEDAGRSGLTFERREGLQKLIADVLSGNVDFDTLLIYDISRWGRFQDIDAAAYYEYICRSAGVHVEYCMERFDNDGSPLAAIVKSLKRVMAAEYSRDLSARVFAGQARLASMGYLPGGRPGFGYRRLMVDEQRRPKMLLGPGELKGLQNDRIVLTLGPPEEVRVIRKIFRLFTEKRWGTTRIANHLNQSGTPSARGGKWERCTVQKMLQNERYAGSILFNTSSRKLASRRTLNRPEEWVRGERAHEPIVSPETFALAQTLFRKGKDWQRTPDEIALAKLKALFEREGRLNSTMIDREPEMPHARWYTKRFGSLQAVYEVVGFKPRKQLEFMPALRRKLKLLRPALLTAVVDGFRSAGAVAELQRDQSIVVDGRIVIVVSSVCCRRGRDGRPAWALRRYPGRRCDIQVYARFDEQDAAPRDFCFIPRRGPFWRQQSFPEVFEHPGVHRSPTLFPLFAHAHAWAGQA
jgi:DNA invertase Pin-like site-specific DNA recombinase